jgi:hypothetical protein
MKLKRETLKVDVSNIYNIKELSFNKKLYNLWFVCTHNDAQELMKICLVGV